MKKKRKFAIKVPTLTYQVMYSEGENFEDAVKNLVMFNAEGEFEPNHDIIDQIVRPITNGVAEIEDVSNDYDLTDPLRGEVIIEVSNDKR